MTLNEIAQAYVQLVLSVGQHDSGYVDAFYGPPAWLSQTVRQPLETLVAQADQLVARFGQLPAPLAEQRLRQQFLGLHLRAVRSYVGQLAGERLAFDAESLALYDAVSPRRSERDFETTLTELGELLPGEGALHARLSRYNQAFEIPRERLDAVFSAAIVESRERTRRYIALPPEESFKIEYVQDQVWSAYNWYKGDSYSLIQVNTDLPMLISRAIDLASHEGYPGHHVFHLLTEQNLVRTKGWVEYSVYPLYSPMSFLSEGSANYGIGVAFSPSQRLAFEQGVLFPLAGMDATQADLYYRVQALLQKLSYAGNMVAQRYLDGEIGRAAAIALMMAYAVYDEKRATQRLGFIERNRTYVINYNLGQDVVQAYVEKRTGAADEAGRWQVFTELLSNPKTASMLLA